MEELDKLVIADLGGKRMVAQEAERRAELVAVANGAGSSEHRTAMLVAVDAQIVWGLALVAVAPDKRIDRLLKGLYFQRAALLSAGVLACVGGERKGVS